MWYVSALKLWESHGFSSMLYSHEKDGFLYDKDFREIFKNVDYSHNSNNYLIASGFG